MKVKDEYFYGPEPDSGGGSGGEARLQCLHLRILLCLCFCLCPFSLFFVPFPFSLSLSICLCCQAGKSPPQNIILLTFQLALSSCLDLFDSWRVGDRLDFPDYFIIDIEKVQELGIVSFPQPD